MTAVEVRGASVRFGPHLALDGVDFDVAPGEVVAVVGPSGSGKSTLLRAVAGLQRLDAGSVSLDGIEVDGVPPHRRGVGMMFQDHALFPHHDVAGNIAFGLRRQGHRGPALTARVDELLELVGLAGFGRRPVDELSGGEQQRVALARALAPAPRVLLLDEPTGALDLGMRSRLVHDLRSLISDLALTVVAVTHDPAEAFTLADRLVVLDAGRVRQAGTPEELWTAPGAAVVATVLGLGPVVQGVVRDGVASTPWGEVCVPGPDGPAALLLRPGALQVDPNGRVDAHVSSATFRGPTTDLVLSVDEGPAAPASVLTSQAPAPGSTVRVSLEPSEVVRLPA
ncbi:MAG: ABC transporter ATP-binding protein [Actinomycetota bacterium]|nr:ABC transporter ATP-binding protein [Actinomycetota bacterium]